MTLAKFLRTGAAALGALAVATQANAADIYSGGLKDQPAPPPPLWTGFYAGINLGAAWTDFQKNSNTFYDNAYSGTIPFDLHEYFQGQWNTLTSQEKQYLWALKHSKTPVYLESTGAPFNAGGNNTTDAFGGGQLGYNWQPYGWSNWVLGLEVDLDGVGTNNDRTALATTYGQPNWPTADGKGNTLPGTPPSVSPFITGLAAIRVKQESGFAGDVTGRLGYAWGPALLYAKGGFAWLEFENDRPGDTLRRDLEPARDVRQWL